MPPSRFVRLTEEEDVRLREIEQDARLKPKVRLRAQVLRLSERGNLIGTLSFEGEVEALEYRMLEGSCRAQEVVSYLDLLAEEAERNGKPVVVVLDRAPFHRAGAVRERRPGWEENGRLYYPPSYCPRPNPIEGVWRRVKRFLMPRRFYDSLAEPKQAVLSALNLLGAVEIQC